MTTFRRDKRGIPAKFTRCQHYFHFLGRKIYAKETLFVLTSQQLSYSCFWSREVARTDRTGGKPDLILVGSSSPGPLGGQRCVASAGSHHSQRNCVMNDARQRGSVPFSECAGQHAPKYGFRFTLATRRQLADSPDRYNLT